jgi:hypothetical protein
MGIILWQQWHLFHFYGSSDTFFIFYGSSDTFFIFYGSSGTFVLDLAQMQNVMAAATPLLYMLCSTCAKMYERMSTFVPGTTQVSFLLLSHCQAAPLCVCVCAEASWRCWYLFSLHCSLFDESIKGPFLV